MIPIHLIGAAAAGMAAMNQTRKGNKTQSINPPPRRVPMVRRTNVQAYNRPNPFQGIIQSLNSITQSFATNASKIMSGPKKEDYNEVFKPFLPAGALLITPQYQSEANVIRSIDLDGDSVNELIASYKLEDEITTIVLKKQNDKWNKISEMMNYDYSTIHYIHFADVTGSGKKDVVIGWDKKDSVYTAEIYAIKGDKFEKLASRDYHRLEVTDFSGGNKIPTAAEIAVWNKKDEESYNVEVLRWNGKDLAAQTDPKSYYTRSVIPYYIQRVKQSPYSAANWYSLSEVLVKAEVYGDALKAIDLGTNYADEALGQKFTELKSSIIQKFN